MTSTAQHQQATQRGTCEMIEKDRDPYDEGLAMNEWSRLTKLEAEHSP